MNNNKNNNGHFACLICDGPWPRLAVDTRKLVGNNGYSLFNGRRVGGWGWGVCKSSELNNNNNNNNNNNGHLSCLTCDVLGRLQILLLHMRDYIYFDDERYY